ncbi:hypothetical protein J7U46_16865 [Pelomonas sp. V22]|uniref:hypothetical protein n=1 Tax=Pelomonas sp. V22 TaxID=2822139 RepID=UPI0024A839E4|nr:hypothetical protein [Pelomonas sp. V22]MDI4634735.1 hypothetical protein [Pelomonas sp. V22]
MKNLIQALVAASLLATATFAAAAPQKVEQLPRVVITGKSVQSQQVVQLPRVVIEGRSLQSQQALFALNTQAVRRAARGG